MKSWTGENCEQTDADRCVYFWVEYFNFQSHSTQKSQWSCEIYPSCWMMLCYCTPQSIPGLWFFPLLSIRDEEWRNGQCWTELILLWRLQRLNQCSVRWVPIRIEDILQLRDDGGVVSSKAHSGGGVEVIPDEVAGADVGPRVTDSILAMVHPGVARVTVTCRSTALLRQCRPGLIVPGNYIVSDLHLAATVVILWRCAEDVGVQKVLQIIFGVWDEVCPVGNKKPHSCILWEDHLSRSNLVAHQRDHHVLILANCRLNCF